MSKNKIVLACPEGPCAGASPPATTDVVVEVREVGASASTPLEVAGVEVTLTRIGEGPLQAASTKQGANGGVIASFNAVPQGWYRALAVRRVNGEIESSAARRVQLVKLKGPAQVPQPVILTLSKQGVARFQFVTELDAPVKNTNVIVRHPDGTEQRHTTNGIGELRLGGATGEVFSLVRFEHAGDHDVVSAELREGT